MQHALASKDCHASRKPTAAKKHLQESTDLFFSPDSYRPPPTSDGFSFRAVRQRGLMSSAPNKLKPKSSAKVIRAAIEQLGGNHLAIQMLYATPRIHRGETAQICYGVANAKTVTLEPQSGKVLAFPQSLRRCKTSKNNYLHTGCDWRRWPERLPAGHRGSPLNLVKRGLFPQFLRIYT